MVISKKATYKKEYFHKIFLVVKSKEKMSVLFKTVICICLAVSVSSLTFEPISVDILDNYFNQFHTVNKTLLFLFKAFFFFIFPKRLLPDSLKIIDCKK